VTEDSLQSLRLAFKRAFTAYFLDLNSPAIADPTEAFATCRAYLSALRERLGQEEFMHRLDDETTHMAGHIEQDLRYRVWTAALRLEDGEVEDRLRECFEYGLGQLDERG